MRISKTLIDTVFTSLTSIARLLAQFLAIPILARLLSPEDYGIVAMALPYVFFAMVISDAGIGMSLIRTSVNNYRVWSTCFWISLILGSVLTSLLFLGAPFFSLFLEEPRLEPIVKALAFTVFLQSFFSIPGAELQQSQRFKLLSIIEIFSIAVGIIIAIFAARNGAGPWALVFQQLAFYILRAILNFWFSTFRPRLYFSWQEAKSHIKFGGNLLAIELIRFLSKSADKIVIGKLLTVAAVGVYSMAFQFAQLPSMLVTGPLQYVFYAKLSKIKEDTIGISKIFIFLTRVLAIIIFPFVGMVAAAHQPVFTVLLSDKWLGSGNIYMLIAAASSLNAVMGISNIIRIVLGRTDLQLRIVTEQGLLWVFMLLSVASYGIEWLAIAYSIVFIAYAPRQLMITLPIIRCTYGVYFKSIIIPIVCTLIGIGSYTIIVDFYSINLYMQIITAAFLSFCCMLLAWYLQKEVIKSEMKLLALID